MRRALDAELVRRGLAADRDEARRLIEARSVLVSNAIADKPGRQVDSGEPVRVSEPARFVGRGGHKLEAALDRFGVDVTGLRVVDAGASTGGFTDCLLQRGAVHVWAVDVGRNQLHERLRGDPRVTSMERTDIRSVTAASVGGPVPLVVGDLSFISLTAVAPHLAGLLAADGELVVLVKPQFEAERAAVSRGRGVISDPDVWRGAVDAVDAALAATGASMMGIMPSPIRGAEGNVEFLVHAAMDPPDARVPEREASIEAALVDARRLLPGDERP
jgi:23S rRNA (cytidine1920-2'-O)/16S rRNA (cytidine1409-2'-O)-methyltransferase